MGLKKRAFAGPMLVAIDHDDYHAKHVGRTRDGRQFFLTQPFVPKSDTTAGCEYVALFLFGDTGTFLEARIDSFGPRSDVDTAALLRCHETHLESLGAVSLERIEVHPFATEQFGVTFGLITRIPEDDQDVWAVELMPGNYMAFFEPWDSGEYDT